MNESPQFKDLLYDQYFETETAEPFTFALPAIKDEDPSSVELTFIRGFDSRIMEFKDMQITVNEAGKY